jgi:hypothetical protein
MNVVSRYTDSIRHASDNSSLHVAQTAAFQPNATVHRAAANDIDFTKPRGPRLRVQRFVRRHSCYGA